MNKFETDFLAKYDSGYRFLEDELRQLVWETHVVDRDSGEDGRWSRPMTNVFEVGDRYFEIMWEKGLTEYQDNIYHSQPREVIPSIKTIEIKEWRPVAAKG